MDMRGLGYTNKEFQKKHNKKSCRRTCNRKIKAYILVMEIIPTKKIINRDGVRL